jgi:hypothetical protein
VRNPTPRIVETDQGLLFVTIARRPKAADHRSTILPKPLVDMPLRPGHPLMTETPLYFRVFGRIDGGPWSWQIAADSIQAATFSIKKHAEQHTQYLTRLAEAQPSPKVEYAILPVYGSRFVVGSNKLKLDRAQLERDDVEDNDEPNPFDDGGDTMPPAAE